MKLLLAVCYVLYLVNAKLVSKTEEENAAKEVRVITTSKEEEPYRYSEYCKFYTLRNPRHSDEHATKSNVTEVKRTENAEVALVKKPIPKFIDTGSEEDYQAKIPNKISDSVEHEDEDFSVDDYDFDVNHDEFSGRGKPLEPRAKVKVSRLLKPTPAKIEPQRHAATLSQSKVKVPHAIKPSIKVARKAPADKMKEEEYDEEFSPMTKSPEKQRKTIKVKDTSSMSEENEDSKEEEVNRPTRTTRSSTFIGTYLDKLGESTSSFMSKMLSYLPLFPQSYSSPQVNKDDVFAANAPLLDP